jgi:hypothetical protein
MTPKRLPFSTALEFRRNSRVAAAPRKLGIVAAAQKLEPPGRVILEMMSPGKAPLRT